jgi:hypothetical protein
MVVDLPDPDSVRRSVPVVSNTLSPAGRPCLTALAGGRSPAVGVSVQLIFDQAPKVLHFKNHGSTSTGQGRAQSPSHRQRVYRIRARPRPGRSEHGEKPDCSCSRLTGFESGPVAPVARTLSSYSCRCSDIGLTLNASISPISLSLRAMISSKGLAGDARFAPGLNRLILRFRAARIAATVFSPA